MVTASFASSLAERVAEIEQESQSATRGDVHALHDQVRALQTELASCAGAG